MPNASAFNDAAIPSRHILEEKSVFYGTVNATGSATPVQLSSPTNTPVILPTGHAREMTIFVHSDKLISVFRRKYFCNRLFYVTDIARPVPASATAESTQIGPDAFSIGLSDEMELLFANTAAIAAANNATVSITMIARG